jgi:hypothetical protein
MYHLTAPVVNRKHIIQCQGQLGGFSKELLAYPDLLHSYMSISGLLLIATLLQSSDSFYQELRLDVTLGLKASHINQT